MRVASLTRSTIGWILILGLALTGCRKSEEQKAKETAQTFFSAADRNDAIAFRRTLTLEAREHINVERGTSYAFKGDYILDQSVVTDDTAQVFFTITDKDGPTKGHLKLRQEAGEWRVYAITVKAIPGGGEMTFNFEKPAAVFADLFREFPNVMAEGVKALGEGFKAMGEGFKSAGEQIKRDAAEVHTGK